MFIYLLFILIIYLQLIRAMKTINIFDVRVVDYKAKVYPFLDQINVRNHILYLKYNSVADDLSYERVCIIAEYYIE